MHAAAQGTTFSASLVCLASAQTIPSTVHASRRPSPGNDRILILIKTSPDKQLYRPSVAVCQGTAQVDTLADAQPEPCQQRPERPQLLKQASATTIATRLCVFAVVIFANGLERLD